MMSGDELLLTIAVPTWKRAEYLRITLGQLRREIESVAPGRIEVIVSDNCSPDHTGEVVTEAIQQGLAVRYVRNTENIGWGRNFFQCFNLAQARYVLVLGDDDVLLDGTLDRIMHYIGREDFGVVCVRPFGYDHDFRAEAPGTAGTDRVYHDTESFLVSIGALATMISACVVNKEKMGRVDTQLLFCGDLAHLHLVLLAALRHPRHLFIDRPLIACKRNNSANYKFSKVFVEEYWRLMEGYVGQGLSSRTLRAIQTKLLFSYYPFYLFLERLADNGDHLTSLQHFSERFGDRWLYRLWIAPILRWPRVLALAWATMATAVGRAAGGELRRGFYFALSKLRWKRV